jgi:hypothetical protein
MGVKQQFSVLTEDWSFGSLGAISAGPYGGRGKTTR